MNWRQAVRASMVSGHRPPFSSRDNLGVVFGSPVPALAINRDGGRRRYDGRKSYTALWRNKVPSLNSLITPKG